jgi:endonuclease/exonuclease/phosphatase (EEP) superfamily protein YafD
MSKLLRAIVAAGLVVGVALLALCVLANWYPPLDIVNDGLPFMAVGAIVLVALAFATGSRKRIGATAILLALIMTLLLSGLPGMAPQAPDDAPRFLRVVTFNLWGRNDHHLDRVAAFLADADADAVVLQEARAHHQAFLETLGARYPHRTGDNGLVILSKHPILSDNRVDRDGYPPWISLMVRRATLDVDGKTVDLAGVHLARPFYPDLQQTDIVALTRFVQEHDGPLILAGDFNMTPWTVKLKDFTAATGLGRFNTFRPTWPMRWHDLPLLPFVPIDNVFASRHFANIETTLGPRLDSDHRPVIADIALIE